MTGGALPGRGGLCSFTRWRTFPGCLLWARPAWATTNGRKPGSPLWAAQVSRAPAGMAWRGWGVGARATCSEKREQRALWGRAGGGNE